MSVAHTGLEKRTLINIRVFMPQPHEISHFICRFRHNLMTPSQIRPRLSRFHCDTQISAPPSRSDNIHIQSYFSGMACVHRVRSGLDKMEQVRWGQFRFPHCVTLLLISVFFTQTLSRSLLCESSWSRLMFLTARYSRYSEVTNMANLATSIYTYSG